MGCVPGWERSCSPVTDPPRSNQASFEVACITKSQNIQHAIRLANTVVFSIDSSLNICFKERISPQMQSGQDFNNPFTNHPHYPPHTHRGGAGGPPNSTHPTTPTGGGTLPLGGGGGGPPGTCLIYIFVCLRTVNQHGCQPLCTTEFDKGRPSHSADGAQNRTVQAHTST